MENVGLSGKKVNNIEPSNKRRYWLVMLILGLVSIAVFWRINDTRDIEYRFDKDSNSILFMANGKNKIKSIELKYGTALEISNKQKAKCQIISYGHEYVTVRYTNRKGEPGVNIFEISISKSLNLVFISQFDIGGKLIDFSSYP